MKIILAIFIYISTINCFSQNTISPRVGNEIDKYEREYFGLFPKLKFFSSAKVFATTDTTILLSIKTGIPSNYPDTVIVIPKKVADNLAQYIENFEYYRYPDHNINWNILGKEAITSKALLSYVKKVKPLRIVAKDNRFYDGIILFANDTLLIIQEGGTEFNWEKAKTNTFVIKSKDIDYIVINKSGNSLMYGLIGAVGVGLVAGLINITDNSTDKPQFAFGGYAIVGGLIGLLIGSKEDGDMKLFVNGNPYNYLDELNTIKKHTVFEDALPPELNTLLQNNLK